MLDLDAACRGEEEDGDANLDAACNVDLGLLWWEEEEEEDKNLGDP